MSRIRLSDHCCQGSDKVIDTNNYGASDLVLATRGDNTLVFSPLGNRPKEPILALVGITPGSQSEIFGDLLRSNSVEKAGSKAAFANGQDAIKQLLRAHGFAAQLGIDLTGDLNDSPKIFTTSLVKCCLKVNGSYKYKAPDIVASPEASFCLSNRFIPDIEKYPTLRWIVIFGSSGWEAVNLIKHNYMIVRDYLESRGLIVLNYPHFAQNFQQRAIFQLTAGEEKNYFAKKPLHRPYAPKAQVMKSAVLEALEKK